MAVVETLQGTGGAASINNITAKFIGWTAQVIGEQFPTTGFGDEGWQTGEIITGQMTGTAIGHIASGATEPVDDGFFASTCGVDTLKGAVELTVDTGKTYNFDATISTVELGRSETGAGSSTVRVDFASTGPVTEAWV
jgi:hypothetical protein